MEKRVGAPFPLFAEDEKGHTGRDRTWSRLARYEFPACQPQQPVYLGETENYKTKLKTKALRIDYPDADVPSSAEVCQSMAPLTLDNPNPTDFWDLTLEEAIQMALKNSKVIRTLNGVSFSQAGVAGVPGTLLSSPQGVGTVYDPALIESDPRYGVEAALSQFDGTLMAGANWVKSDVAPMSGGSIRSRYSGNSFSGYGDYGEFTVGINKYTATGGQFYVNQGSLYNDFGRDSTIRSAWATYLEGGFTQPLLQGNGIQFNRIAGVGATPGFYNGVAIARISTDTALNDFEMAARNLVADVEKAYWNLYYAYHYLESVKSGRDSAHQTWQQTHAKFVHGAVGGSAQYEAQSRNNYYTFRAQTEVAQSNLFKTESVLRYIIGLTSTDGRLIRPVDDPVIAPLRLDWQNVMCESLLRSPELRKQKWDVKRRELELIASKNFLLPRLDFNAGYQWNGAGRDLIQSHRNDNAFASMTGGNYASWVMGLNASMPFGWRKELAGVRNAQLNLAKSRALLQEQELELTHQLADSFREISQAYQQSRTMLNRRIAADDEVSSVNAAYQVGTTTLDQLLEAQQRQAEAETAYYRSIVDYNLAIMTLHYRKGSLLEYNNVGLAEGPWPAKAYFDAKRRVIAQLAVGDQPIADISKALDISIPTITKLIGELSDEGIVKDLGKVETAGGRRPNIFGLKNTEVNFLGAEIADDKITLTVIDIRGHIIASETKSHTGNFIAVLENFANTTDAIAAGVCIKGRINPFSGESYSELGNPDKPLRQKIEDCLGIPVHLDNTTRAHCHTEHRNPNASSTRNMLYADLGRTLTIGIVVRGAIYYGHSGLGGELHNTPLLESSIDDTITAARRDDPHAIELIEQVAEKAGRDIAAILNLLNPELVVVGGPLAYAGDYLMLPLQAAIHKHTPKAVYRDTRFRLAEQHENSGAAGAATIMRNITLGLR